MNPIDEILALSAVQQRRLIGQRSLSPVDLMQACIARIQALNPGVNAIAATDFERALATARQAEAAVMRGETLPLLHGAQRQDLVHRVHSAMMPARCTSWRMAGSSRCTRASNAAGGS